MLAAPGKKCTCLQTQRGLCAHLCRWRPPGPRTCFVTRRFPVFFFCSSSGSSASCASSCSSVDSSSSFSACSSSSSSSFSYSPFSPFPLPSSSSFANPTWLCFSWGALAYVTSILRESGGVTPIPWQTTKLFEYAGIYTSPRNSRQTADKRQPAPRGRLHASYL